MRSSLWQTAQTLHGSSPAQSEHRPRWAGSRGLMRRRCPQPEQIPLAARPFLWQVEQTGPLAHTMATTRSRRPHTLHVALVRAHPPQRASTRRPVDVGLSGRPTYAAVGRTRLERAAARRG